MANPLSALTSDVNPSSQQLNWLRAGILGANDGIVSIAAIVAGVSGASLSDHGILVAAFAGLFGGALSMAIGEYVSVSAQRDAEIAMMERGKHPQLSIGEEDGLVSGWHAAWASLLAFLVGGVIPFLSALIPGANAARPFILVISVLLALGATGFIGARLGGSAAKKSVLRNLAGGTIAMGVTYGAGLLVSLLG